MKVIFLDIDGVLNSTRSCAAYDGYPWPGASKERDWHKFDDVAVKLLRRLCQKTGAVCVLSSSWRLHMNNDDIRDLAKYLGVNIVGCTREHKIDPYGSYGSEVRGYQIQDWLDSRPYVESYVIIDDSTDMLYTQMYNFVRVDANDGLSFHNYLDAYKILNKEESHENI